MTKRDLPLAALVMAGVAVFAYWSLSRGKSGQGNSGGIDMTGIREKLARLFEPGEATWETRARRFASDILSEAPDSAKPGNTNSCTTP